jgi:hypothetical protein
MDEDILVIILSFVVGMTALGCLTAIILTVLKRRPSQLPQSDVSVRLDEVIDRLARLDGSVDTIAVEVERISEAQRFTARVLTERTGAPALPDKGRSSSTTPH